MTDNLKVNNNKGTGPLELVDLIKKIEPQKEKEEKPSPPKSLIPSLEDEKPLDPTVEKLATLLNGIMRQKHDNKAADTSTTSETSTFPTTTTTTTDEINALLAMNMMLNAVLGDIANDLIAEADRLQAILDLSPVPDCADADLQLINALLKVLRKLGKEFDEIAKRIQEKAAKSEYTLRPDATSKDGFNHTIIVK